MLLSDRLCLTVSFVINIYFIILYYILYYIVSLVVIVEASGTTTLGNGLTRVLNDTPPVFKLNKFKFRKCLFCVYPQVYIETTVVTLDFQIENQGCFNHF